MEMCHEHSHELPQSALISLASSCACVKLPASWLDPLDVLQSLMLRTLWHMLQITPTAFATPASATSVPRLYRSFPKSCWGLKPFRSSLTEARPAVSSLPSVGSATAAVKQQEQSALQASVRSSSPIQIFRASDSSRTVAAAGSPGSMQPQQQQYSHLLMSPEHQQQLLESVKDRPPVVFYHYPCVDGAYVLALVSAPS